MTVAKVTHPRYKWRVSYPDGGSRRKKYFAKKSGPGGADEWATEKRSILQQEGAREADVSPAERRAISKFREGVADLPGSGSAATLEQAVEFFLDAMQRRHRSIPVSVISKQLIARVVSNGAGEKYLRTLEGRLARFEAEFGDWLACDVSTEVIDEFLNGLELSTRSILHYRSVLSRLFAYAVEIGASEMNPVELAAKPKARGGDIGILTPSELCGLLQAADEVILPGLLIGFFAGIRRGELDRLDWKEIDFEQLHVEVVARKSKTAQRRLVPIQPNLKAWLQPLRKVAGPVMPSEMIWRRRLREAMEDSGLAKWPVNAPRHSFASYRLAATQDAARVSLELGHTSPAILFEHYRALVTPRAAKSYWAIAPDTKEPSTLIATNRRRA